MRDKEKQIKQYIIVDKNGQISLYVYVQGLTIITPQYWFSKVRPRLLRFLHEHVSESMTLSDVEISTEKSPQAIPAIFHWVEFAPEANDR